MIDISECSTPDFKQFKNNDLYYECQECKKYIKVNQIFRKKIDDYRDFLILVYYCRKCDTYYFKFKNNEVNKSEEWRQKL